jgi:phasin family protein
MADAFDTKSAATDFTRFLANLRLPTPAHMDAMMQTCQRNFEALASANRVALEGAQLVARRHSEIMQQAMGEMSEAMRAVGGAESPQERGARQAELLKRGYERAVTELQELADVIQKANSEALGVLNRRFAEALDEVKQVMETSRG